MSAVSEPKQTKLPMACRCGPDNQAICDDVRRQARELMWKGLDPELLDQKAMEANFVSEVIYSLEHELEGGFHIGSVHADQWLGLRLAGSDEEVYIECDLLEDGLAAAYLYVTANYRRLDS